MHRPERHRRNHERHELDSRQWAIPRVTERHHSDGYYRRLSGRLVRVPDLVYTAFPASARRNWLSNSPVPSIGELPNR